MSAAPPTMPRLFAAAGPGLAENRTCFGDYRKSLGRS